MDLHTVLERLQNRYYRRKEALAWDIQLIAHNATIFNEPDAPITHSALYLASRLNSAIEGWFLLWPMMRTTVYNLDQSITSMQMAFPEIDKSPEPAAADADIALIRWRFVAVFLKY